MKIFRFLLFPLSLLYGFIMFFRNFLYDKRILKSYKAPIPIIAVGNLSVGGTGKSPQIEYLIRLLSKKYIAVLSRGYKRKSKGFVLADSTAKVEDLGDEPFQFFCKFPTINVAVDTNRTRGIKNLLQLKNPPKIILLDDAFQHRKVQATIYILLTAYNDLYVDDFVLPVGNLRESKNGVKRADVVVVTKCPKNMSNEEKECIKNKLSLKNNQKLFFTTINYGDFVFSANSRLKISEIKDREKVILAGIAKPDLFFNFLKNKNDILLKYSDHHNFSEHDIRFIKQKAKGKIIVTTEKDYVRIREKFSADQLFYLPIKSHFLEGQNAFNQLITSLYKKIQKKQA